MFPEHFDYYDETLEKGLKATKDCAPAGFDAPYASFTLNMGRRSCSELHVDGSNLAAGLCVVSPYGKFDWKKGGHLILHELKVVLALPPGSIAIFPSALISHENVPIGIDEERRVFTAYSPARLFQWVSNNFQPVGDAEIGKMGEKRKRGAEDWLRHVKMFRHGCTF